MLPTRNVRSRFSGYQPQGEGRMAGGAFDDGAAGAASYLQQAGFQPTNALASAGPAQDTGYAPQWNALTGGSQGGDGDGQSGFSGMDVSRMGNDELARMYAGQNALVNFMQTPGGWATRAIGGAMLPGVGSLFGMLQGPILMGYQNEMARRGLAMQTPEPGDWNRYDARAFDLGFYGIGESALNARGGRFEGQRTSTFGGNPATTGSWLESASLPGSGGDSDGFDTSSYGDLGGLY